MQQILLLQGDLLKYIGILTNIIHTMLVLMLKIGFLFPVLIVDIFLCLADGKSIKVEQSCITPSPNGPFCSLCPSRGRTVGSGPFLGWISFTFLT